MGKALGLSFLILDFFSEISITFSDAFPGIFTPASPRDKMQPEPLFGEKRQNHI